MKQRQFQYIKDSTQQHNNSLEVLRANKVCFELVNSNNSVMKSKLSSIERPKSANNESF